MRRSATRLLIALGVLAAVLAGGWALDAGAPVRSEAQVLPLPSSPGEEAALVGLAQVAEVEGVMRAEHEAAVLAALESQAEAERLVRIDAARQSVPTAPAPFSAVRPGCEGDWPIPAWIVARESGCNYGAVNATGCGGHSCVGAYQFDLRHWIAREDGGWGGCAHYGDWRVPEHQDACAVQMSRGGTNLAPWGY